jgi:hypothetical protein
LVFLDRSMDSGFKRSCKRLGLGKDEKLGMGLNGYFERVRSGYIETGPAGSKRLELSSIVEESLGLEKMIFKDSRRRGNGKLMVPSMSGRDRDLEIPIIDKKVNLSSIFFKKFKLGQINNPRGIEGNLKTWSLVDSRLLRHRSHTNLPANRQQPDISDPNKDVFRNQRFKSLDPSETELEAGCNPNLHC